MTDKTSKVAGVAAYDSRLVEIWKRAYLEDVEVPMESKAAGVAFRHRMYRLRAAMQRELHPAYENAAKCSIPNPYQRGPQWYIRVGNADKKYEAALVAAGFDVPPPPPLLD
jgi:hypothetical protein